MSGRPIFSIAKITFKESVRNKIFYNILLFGLLLISSSLVLNKMTVGDETKIVKDLGLTSISLLGFLTILLLATTHLNQEFEEKIIYSILVKPIGRGHYLLGKYLGILFVLLVQTGAMSMLTFGILLFLKGIVWWNIVKGVYAIFLELTLLTAVTLFFSTFMRPQVSVITILAVYLIGHSTSELRTIMVEKGYPLAYRIVELVHFLFPNFDNFSISTQVIHNLALPPSHLPLVTIYALFYTALLMIISTRIFRRREF